MNLTGYACFFDHNTSLTTSRDDHRLPPNVDDNTPQYKQRPFRQKVVDFRYQPRMTVLPGKCAINVRRCRMLEDSYGAVMALTAEDLKKQLVVHFEEELNDGGVSR